MSCIGLTIVLVVDRLSIHFKTVNSYWLLFFSTRHGGKISARPRPSVSSAMFYWWFSHSCPVIFCEQKYCEQPTHRYSLKECVDNKIKINIAFWFSYLVTRQLARSQSRTASIIFQPTDQMFERFINFVRFRTVALYRCQLKIKIMGNADWWLSAELIIWLLYLSKLGVPGT